MTISYTLHVIADDRGTGLEGYWVFVCGLLRIIWQPDINENYIPACVSAKQIYEFRINSMPCAFEAGSAASNHIFLAVPMTVA